jgi:hypothetical protein
MQVFPLGSVVAINYLSATNTVLSACQLANAFVMFVNVVPSIHVQIQMLILMILLVATCQRMENIPPASNAHEEMCYLYKKAPEINGFECSLGIPSFLKGQE